jgi:hypothetical protein
VLVDVIDDRWGMTLAGGRIEGSEHAILNNARGYVKVTGTTLSGALDGIIHRMSGAAASYTQKALPSRRRSCTSSTHRTASGTSRPRTRRPLSRRC